MEKGPVKPAKVETAAVAEAASFMAGLQAHQSDEELAKIQRYFKSGEGEYGQGDRFMGVRMGLVFALAKEFIDMPPGELEKLLESSVHEVRAGALSIMDKQGRRNKTEEARRKELYDLYLRRHDRINNWDLVDLAAPFVVGRYLFDKQRDVLDRLAGSADLWERRTAIVSTAYFIRQGEAAGTFRIAERLVDDAEPLIQKAVGGWVRAAGDVEPDALLEFLGRNASTMSRTALRYALEHLEAPERERFMRMKDEQAGRERQG